MGAQAGIGGVRQSRDIYFLGCTDKSADRWVSNVGSCGCHGPFPNFGGRERGLVWAGDPGWAVLSDGAHLTIFIHLPARQIGENRGDFLAPRGRDVGWRRLAGELRHGPKSAAGYLRLSLLYGASDVVAVRDGPHGGPKEGWSRQRPRLMRPQLVSHLVWTRWFASSVYVFLLRYQSVASLVTISSRHTCCWKLATGRGRLMSFPSSFCPLSVRWPVLRTRAVAVSRQRIFPPTSISSRGADH